MCARCLESPMGLGLLEDLLEAKEEGSLLGELVCYFGGSVGIRFDTGIETHSPLPHTGHLGNKIPCQMVTPTSGESPFRSSMPVFSLSVTQLARARLREVS